MLTRQSIASGAYLKSFDTMPKEIRWTPERIQDSLAETMQSRPASGEIWIFGYGSLIWNPLLDFDRRQWATLSGWHRSFCLRMIAGRGSDRRPGRMLALEPGGVTRGMAFRLSDAGVAEDLPLVWTREMPFGTYRPRWEPITLADGSRATAIAFVADPQHPLYENDASVASVAPLVATASGAFGSNADYVLNLEAALANGGVTDDYVAALAAELKRLG